MLLTVISACCKPWQGDRVAEAGATIVMEMSARRSQRSFTQEMDRGTRGQGRPGRGGRLTSLDASFVRCFGFFQTSSKTSRSMFSSKHHWNIASLSKKCDVLCEVLGFRWLGPTMLKLVRIFNINAYVIWYCWPCQYFCQQIIMRKKHIVITHCCKNKGIYWNFQFVQNCHQKHR